MKHLVGRLRQSRLLTLLLKGGLTAGALWLAFRDIDAAYLGDILNQQDHAKLALAALLMAGQLLLGALRWQLILNALGRQAGKSMRLGEAIKIYYITVFFTCCLPGTVGGDVVRVWLARSDHVPLSQSIHSVIIDRMIALGALALMVLATLPWLGELSGFDAMPILALSALLAVAGVWFLLHIERLLAPLSHVRPVKWLLYFVGSLRVMLAHPLSSVLSLLYALCAHACFCFCAMVLAHSLAIDMTPLQSLMLVPPVMLAITLPISIGGWGVREAGMVGMLGLAGVPAAAALMLSVQLGLMGILISLPAGLLWLLRRQRKVREGEP